MDGRIVLNSTEQRRIIVLNYLSSGALVNAEAAELGFCPVAASLVDSARARRSLN